MTGRANQASGSTVSLPRADTERWGRECSPPSTFRTLVKGNTVGLPSTAHGRTSQSSVRVYGQSTTGRHRKVGQGVFPTIHVQNVSEREYGWSTVYRGRKGEPPYLNKKPPLRAFSFDHGPLSRSSAAIANSNVSATFKPNLSASS